MTNRRATLVLLVVVGLFLAGCGSEKTQVQSNLVGTEWAIVEMTGFPDNNVVDGRFDFTNERFRYEHGNHASSEITWNESGFTVTATGTSTDMFFYPSEARYLRTLVPVGARVEIVEEADGSLTLTRGELTVTAQPA